MAYQHGSTGLSDYDKFIEAINNKDYQTAYKEMLNSKWAKVDSPKRAQKLADTLLEVTGTSKPVKPLKLKASVKKEKEKSIYENVSETVDKGVGATIGTVLSALNFTDNEDIDNISEYLKKGGGASSLPNFGKSALGTEKAKSNQIKVKKPVKQEDKYLVDGFETSEGDPVSNGYSSKSFQLNLNRKNSFKVIDNTLDPNKINNFKPIKGNILFTIQNDVNSSKTGLMPLTKVTGDPIKDGWTKSNHEYVISLDQGNIKVKKASQLKPGDEVFKLKNKIFSMNDLDIKDGKIKVDYDTNIKGLVPVLKKSADNVFKDGNNIIIGLNSDKNKVSNGYIDIAETNLYGRKSGGSFIIFSDDLSQQYMVGGSFKNLYDFHQKLAKKYPKKQFKIFQSDTGTYSNSVFPENGVIDKEIYKKSNTRNTWGNVQHLVLQD